MHRLADAGRLPAAAKLLETGISAAVDTTAFGPSALWASMLTGVVPRVHGIRDSFEVRPDGGGIQPVGRFSWRAPPVWQFLAEAGVAVRLVSCPATSPAAAWADCPGAVVVDERFASATSSPKLDWPLAPGCIQPPELRADLRPMRVHPAELEAGTIGELPARELAYSVSVQAAALALAANANWRFLAVSFPSLDGTDAAHVFIDMLLDHLIGAAGPDTDVLLLSAGGIVLAAGPGFARDELVHGAVAMDVAATILARFGLVDPAAAGRPLPGTLVPTPLAPVRLGLPARPGRTTDPPPPTIALPFIEQVDMRFRYQAAQEAVLLGDHALAVPLLRAALADRPGDLDLTLLLGQTAFALEDAETCAALGAELAVSHPHLPWGALLSGAALALTDDPAADPSLHRAAALAANNPAALLRLGAMALRRDRPAEARDHYAAVLPLAADAPGLRAATLIGLGLAALALDDDGEAEVRFRAALGLQFHAPAIHLQLGLVYARQDRLADAARTLRTAIAQHPGLYDAIKALRDIENAIAAAVLRSGRRV